MPTNTLLAALEQQCLPGLVFVTGQQGFEIVYIEDLKLRFFCSLCALKQKDFVTETQRWITLWEEMATIPSEFTHIKWYNAEEINASYLPTVLLQEM